MPYIKPEALQEARRVDLLSWLQINEPGNLVHVSGKYNRIHRCYGILGDEPCAGLFSENLQKRLDIQNRLG